MPKRKRSPISDVRDAANDMTDGGGLDKRTGKAVAGGAGGVAGAASGAALGSVVGPIGTIVGAIAGAAGGWWAGKNVAEKATDFQSEDDYFRSRFADNDARPVNFTYEQARPAYQLGYLAAQNPDYSGRSFEDIEPVLQRGWTDQLRTQYGDWKNVRGFSADAFARGEERIITRSEEELALKKRPVEAGDVQLRKTVETEHRTRGAGSTETGRKRTEADDQRPSR